MKEKYVIDAGPLSLFFAGRKDVKEFFEEMYNDNAIIYMNEINLAEFIYNYISKVGKDTAIARHRFIRNSPINIVSPDENITEIAAILKSKYSFLSLADAYLIATAKKIGGRVITTDEDIEKKPKKLNI
ncbi:type II toxin-antitoxin system VapC family toxin [Metallosphaera hakonensis]|uniref:type II toxin-antitoxin system VapC family toxin n=1 Tax=Metallosphaera hakonensis TaxID=79601 RepID=UPI00209263CA|nr:type II toxin-antitoxin system VapC family toxin [Metallosphaera hakonensis]